MVTPPKKESKEKIDETPAKKPCLQPFGGQGHEKQTHCKVCKTLRDSNFVGGCCNFCLLGCRQVLGHQRINEVLDGNDSAILAQLAAKSMENRDKKSDDQKPKCRCKCRDMGQYVKQMQALAELIPRLEEILQRFQ